MGEISKHTSEVIDVQVLTRGDGKKFTEIALKGTDKYPSKKKAIWDFKLQEVFNSGGKGTYEIEYEKQDSGAFFMVGAKKAEASNPQDGSKSLNTAQEGPSHTASHVQAQDGNKDREIRGAVILKAAIEFLASQDDATLENLPRAFSQVQRVLELYINGDPVWVEAAPEKTEEVKDMESSVPF